MLTYRWSSKARQYIHIKVGPYHPNSGSGSSRVCCGMCDCSARGDWQESTDITALPFRLTLCPRCIDAIGTETYLRLVRTGAHA